MFAPPIKAPKAKPASPAPPAHRSKLLQSPAACQPQAADPKREASPEGARSASWDFSKIPLFAPDRPSGPEAPRPFIQPKLMIGRVNDPLEHEADRVADQVTRVPTWDVSAAAAPAKISRKCAECEVEEEKLQRKEAGLQAAIGEAPASVHDVLRSPGRPLDDTTRAYFEPRLGQDFRYVRVHVDARAAESARGLNAYAYTVGHNMVFDAGRFAPGTHEGRRLIAHELTHVVQQSGSVATVQRAPTPAADPSAERPAAPIPIEEQLEAQLEAEDALGLKWSKRKDKSYAWSLGQKDRARIRKNWKMSPKLQQEITVKVRFFEGEAKVAYLRTIGPALEEFPEEAIEILAPPPSTEKPCPIGQTILVYQGKPGQGRCITENDTEFRQNYIDNYIVQADPLAIPNTTLENVDHDRVPQMQLTYKDGRKLVVDVKDIPRGESFRKSESTGGTRWLLGPARYEKRSDGFIYPIRSTGERDYVSYSDAENIKSLRAGLYDSIEELKLGFQLLELGFAFSKPIAALGGFASLNRPGGLFQRVPRKQTKTGTGEPPVPSTRTKTDPKTPPKRTVTTEGEETQSTGVTRTEDDPTGYKGEKKRPPAVKIGKEPTEEPSPKVGGKERDEPEDPKGKMTETLAEPALSAKAVDHVFEGDEFGGYHSKVRGWPNPNVKVIKNRYPPDTHGVYKLKIQIKDPKTGEVVTTKDSTFFPDHWSEQRVISETYAVMRANPPDRNSKGFVVSQGTSPSGVVIRIDYMNGEVASFYPVHPKDL